MFGSNGGIPAETDDWNASSPIRWPCAAALKRCSKLASTVGFAVLCWLFIPLESKISPSFVALSDAFCIGSQPAVVAESIFEVDVVAVSLGT